MVAILLIFFGSAGPCLHDKVGDSKCSIEIRQLRDPDPVERRWAAEILGRRKCRKAVPHLIVALRDQNDTVRAWSAWALAEIKDRAAIDPIISAVVEQEKRRHLDVLGSETGCLADMYLALQKLSGQDFGYNQAKWLDWRKKNRQSSRVP